MSVRPDPVIPETRRRRASTTEKSERILKMSRSLTLTRSVLAGTLAEATPNQLDFIERWFTAELDSRERSNACACSNRPASPPTRPSTAMTGPT